MFGFGTVVLSCVLWVDTMSFKVKTSHAIKQVNSGKRDGYDTLMLAINKEEASDGQYLSSMDLRHALDYLQRKVRKIVSLNIFLYCFFLWIHCKQFTLSKLDVQVASADARDQATWLKGSLDDYPHLPLPPAQLFFNADALKGYQNWHFCPHWHFRQNWHLSQLIFFQWFTFSSITFDIYINISLEQPVDIFIKELMKLSTGCSSKL